MLDQRQYNLYLQIQIQMLSVDLLVLSLFMKNNILHYMKTLLQTTCKIIVELTRLSCINMHR